MSVSLSFLPYIIVGFPVIFVIWGIFFIIRGLKNNGREERRGIVPISDVKELRNLYHAEKNAPVTPPSPVQPQIMTAPSQTTSTPLVNPIASHVVQQNLKEQPGLPKNEPPKASIPPGEKIAAQPEKDISPVPAQPSPAQADDELDQLKKEINAWKDQAQKDRQKGSDDIEKLREENRRLEEALRLEISSKDMKTLAQEERGLFLEKERQLTQAQTSIHTLTEENVRLKRQIDDLQHQQEFQQKQLKDHVDLIRCLRQELNSLQEKMQSSEQKEHQQKEGLQREKMKLLEEANVHQQRVHQLQQEIFQWRERYEAGLRDTQQTVQFLRAQIDALQDARKDNLQREIGMTQSRSENFQKDNVQLVSEKQVLERQLKQLAEQYQDLLDREKMLQYELVKSRAQALGLEKICEDFKIHIEQRRDAFETGLGKG